MPRTSEKAQKTAAREAYHRIARTPKAADPERYTKNPHDYGDVLLRGGKLGGALQRDIVYWIERRTWGEAKRPEYARISVTEFARLCQTWDDDADKLRPADRKNVLVQLADLERRGIIAPRDRKGCGKTTAKMYKLTPERWEKAEAYKPPTPKQIEEATAEDEAIETDETTTESATETTETTVTPGKLSKPQPVSVSVSRTAPPVTIRLVYNPTGFPCPVTFRSRTGANGRVQISAEPAKGEGTANHWWSAHHQSFANHSPSSDRNKALSDFGDLVNTISLNTWGFALENDQVRKIFAALDGAPAGIFRAIAEKKLSGRTAAKDHSPGLFVKLAGQARRVWAVQADLEARQRAAAPPAPNPRAKAKAAAAGAGDVTDADLIEVAKREGFSLEEVRQLLKAGDR